jgi:hypothetical protein
MMAEMVKAFEFQLVGETKLDGHDVYFLQASRRPAISRRIRRHKR